MESMNVDVDKLPSERRMRELLTILVRWNRSGAAPAPILAIRHMGRAIGVHELTHLSPGCSAVMHAHIWQARYRGIGIGSVSYPAAMRIFFDRFALKCIRFETPIDNLSAQSVKRKLGIEPQGEGTIDMPMLRTPVKRSAIACCATNWKISRNSSTRSQVDRESRSTPAASRQPLQSYPSRGTSCRLLFHQESTNSNHWRSLRIFSRCRLRRPEQRHACCFGGELRIRAHVAPSAGHYGGRDRSGDAERNGPGSSSSSIRRRDWRCS